MADNTDNQEVLVTLYYSSVSGSYNIKQDQKELENIFYQFKIPYKSVDISLDENSNVKKTLHRENGRLVIPQVFVRDEYKASAEDIRVAIEEANLYGFLGVPEYTIIKSMSSAPGTNLSDLAQ
ncbi:hypothetical protein BCR32DRAFT_270076 [Anaeromyces robustus]|uniref:Thioredoxin-like protein n=1 Tax=Anaeromyces robustus TaxID=1754192 RepID=A0A1Y1WXX5_9FUNG|nr:hypothetical protein BCR32DRAFT_270076 [Anaeromyces robustus]|eukprot:ORX78429.1 hypothetical protein BCR32DRAFT_270076 [Anaeromyces robustus]